MLLLDGVMHVEMVAKLQASGKELSYRHISRSLATAAGSVQDFPTLPEIFMLDAHLAIPLPLKAET